MPAEPPQYPAGSSLQRRTAARTAVVWDAVREVLEETSRSTGQPAAVVDIGGGTGGFAVRVAELGHRVVVVDPSPDALAILSRRADESGVADRVTGCQGGFEDLPDLLPDLLPHTGEHAGKQPSEQQGADVVLCHGVLEIVDDPATALAALARVLRPGGTLSLLVSQRHAAVVARAMAGHFGQARSMLDTDPPAGPATEVRQRRFTADEITALLDEHGLDVQSLHAVRVFVDLVPSSLVDLEPGAAQALVELEQAVSTRPEYLALATQVHALATRR